MLHRAHLYHFVVSIHFHNVYDAVFVIRDQSQWNEDDQAIDSLPLTLVRKKLFATIGTVADPGTGHLTINPFTILDSDDQSSWFLFHTI